MVDSNRRRLHHLNAIYALPNELIDPTRFPCGFSVFIHNKTKTKILTKHKQICFSYRCLPEMLMDKNNICFFFLYSFNDKKFKIIFLKNLTYQNTHPHIWEQPYSSSGSTVDLLNKIIKNNIFVVKNIYLLIITKNIFTKTCSFYCFFLLADRQIVSYNSVGYMYIHVTAS